MLYPMKLEAPLKDYLWGGTRLKDEYGKKTNFIGYNIAKSSPYKMILLL